MIMERNKKFRAINNKNIFIKIEDDFKNSRAINSTYMIHWADPLSLFDWTDSGKYKQTETHFSAKLIISNEIPHSGISPPFIARI